jgi:N4-gp56 family major capsid protein
LPNLYTDILSGTSLGTNLVTAAYDKLVEYALRSMPLFRVFATKKVADQSHPGDSIKFNLYDDLAVATSALSETTDPDSVQVPDTNVVTVTLAEYGNATLTTRKLRLFALSDVDVGVANIVAYNQANSLDEVVRNVLRQGTNVTRENAGVMLFNSGSAGAVDGDDLIKSRDVRASVAKLRARNAMPWDGSHYITVLHPDVSYDLRSEAGSSATWRPPHEQSAASSIWAGNIGTYEGSIFIESPRTYQANDGSGSEPVHRTLMVGQQALAEVVAEEPHVVVGPVIDKLMRFRPVGWYGVLGWARYREEAIQRIETASSIT